MGAVEEWEALVAGSPDVAAAFEALGTRGGERRSRVRRRAAELDVGRFTIPDLAWELQSAAADGDVRERVAAARARYRHEAQVDAAQTVAAARTGASASIGSEPAAGSRGHTAAFVIALILAFLAPALVMPRFRGGGFVYDVDQVALLSGGVSLALAIVGLVYVLRVHRPLFGAAIPVILGVWVAVGAVVASVRLADEPALAAPSAIAGIVLMGVAVLVQLGAAVVRWRAGAGGRSARLQDWAGRGAGRGAARGASGAGGGADPARAALAAALAGEDADTAALRRAAFADGILTLMKRGELDEYDAGHLLRTYAL